MRQPISSSDKPSLTLFGIVTLTVGVSARKTEYYNYIYRLNNNRYIYITCKYCTENSVHFEYLNICANLPAES